MRPVQVLQKTPAVAATHHRLSLLLWAVFIASDSASMIWAGYYCLSECDQESAERCSTKLMQQRQLHCCRGLLAIGAGGAIGHGTTLHVECGSLRYSSSSCGTVTTSVWEYCPSKCFGELKVGLELSGDCIPLQERSSPQTVSCPGLS